MGCVFQQLWCQFQLEVRMLTLQMRSRLFSIEQVIRHGLHI